tara:strand:- start:19 stop:231 length:213 start_codon:yes stop_codon:yes gene_type:complete
VYSVGASMNRENENKAIEICKCTVLALVEKQEKTSQNGRAVNQNMFQQPKQTQKLIKNISPAIPLPPLCL